MPRSAIRTDQAPAAIGPYSQAVRVGDLLFTSGQIPLDPASGAMVTGDIAAQTVRVLDNLDAVLAAGGASWADVAKATIYLADLGDFATVNELYGRRFEGPPPARSTVQVARLPRDARVEIDLVAVIGSGAAGAGGGR
jgi:2-iminobutanoate/2-iminopropanoate deaminase